MQGHLIECPSADRLMEWVRAKSGLDDFGDRQCDIPLNALISSFQKNAWPRMSEAARKMAVETLVGYLQARARIVQDRKRFPEIAAERVATPFIVVGPPRSGSTLLHTLLSLDPANIAPPHWNCLEPSPPRGLGPPTEARIEAATARLTRFFDQIPDLYIQHSYLIEEGANSLGECGSDIMVMAMTTKAFWYYYPVDDYLDYLLKSDHSAAVAFHHQFLQHGQWRMGAERWALKGADHMLWLSQLARQYPDAMLLWTHRDLEQMMSSIASVFRTCRGVSGAQEQHGLPEMAREAVAAEAAIFARALKDREAIGEDPFCDVSYHEMIADPVGTVDRVYARFGLTLSDQATANIRRWVEDNPQQKHGAHQHSAESSNLDKAEINRQFADYRDRFGFGFGERVPIFG